MTERSPHCELTEISFYCDDKAKAMLHATLCEI